MFTKGQQLEIEITDTADGQQCFGRLPEGLAVFVQGAAAVGDLVRASVFKVKKNYLEARLLEVVRPSPTRVTPACAHFGVCGGCKWQHVGYPEQLRIKRKLVADALVHLGGFADAKVLETLPSPQVFGYRNKMEFSFGDRRYLLESEMASAPGRAGFIPAIADVKSALPIAGVNPALPPPELSKPANFALGFHAPGRFDRVVDVDLCHIATPEMNQALTLVKAWALRHALTIYSTHTHTGYLRNLVVRHAAGTGEFMVYLVTSTSEPALMAGLLQELKAAFNSSLTTFVNGVTSRKNTVARGDQDIVLHGPGFIREVLDGLSFEISPGSFFQTNSRQAEVLYRETVARAQPRPDEVVYDLYCGTGTIALFLARRCRAVVGAELEPSAIADAERNACANGLEQVRFLPMDLQHFAEAARALPADLQPGVVVVDPPRVGLHPKLVEELRRLAPRRIVYVSCNPASLARDAQLLCAGGLYALGEVQPVDLFPHTYHVESVVALERV